MIDYNAKAALYLGSTHRGALAQGPRIFPNAAKAIRFALEEAAPVSLRGASLVVDGRTYDGSDVSAFYRTKSYPLIRKTEQAARLREPAEM